MKRRRLGFDALEQREMLSAGPVNPSGPQFMVNTTTQGTQTLYPAIGFPCAPTVAMDSRGNTVAVWESQQLNSSGQPTGYYTLLFQLYTKTFDNSIGNYDLQPLGSETSIAVVPTGSNATTEAAVGVARAPTSGNFVVTWMAPAALGQSLSTASTYAQLYAASGTPIGSQILVGGSGTFLRSVAMNDNGFDILYATSQNGTWSAFDVERYSSSGAVQGRPITVTNPTLTGGTDAIAMSSTGNFIVVWPDTVVPRHGGTVTYTTNVQRFSSTGKAVGGAIQLNQNTSPEQIWSNAGMDAAGDFVVTWGDINNNQFFRQVTASGALGNIVNVGSASSPQAPAIAVQPSGAFDLTYSSGGSSVGQTFSASGTALQAPFQMNGAGSLAVDGLGDLAVIWNASGTAGPGDTGDVFGQFFVDPPAPAANSPTTSPSSPSGVSSAGAPSSGATDAVFAAYPGDDDTLA